MTWKTDILLTKRKTTRTTEFSKVFVTLILLASMVNSPTLNKKTQNSKPFLMTQSHKETSNKDNQLLKLSKELNSKRLLMRPTTRELLRMPILKEREKNSPSFHQSSLKQEDSSQTTSKHHHSSKREPMKPPTSHHKSSSKLPHT